MKYSPQFFREGLPSWKRKKDPPLTRLIYRPLSFYVSSFFCEIGWTANMVSLFSIIVGFGAALSFFLGHSVIGALLVNLWLVLDCSDGNIARCIKSEPFGDFVDGIAGYICSSTVFVGAGYCLFNTGGIFIGTNNVYAILIGAAAGLADVLSRLIYQKYLNTAFEQGQQVAISHDPAKATGIYRLRMLIDQQVAIGGILPFCLFIAAVFNALDCVVFPWGFYYCCVFFATIIMFSYKVLTFQAGK